MKKAKKGVSWLDLIVAIPAGKEEDFPLKNKGTIKPLISSRVKDKYPERIYSASEVQKPGVLTVKRIA